MARQRQVISDPTLLAAALEGLILQKDRIEEQIRNLRGILGKRSPGRPAKAAAAAAVDSDSAEKPRKRRKMSAAARKRIAEAQKKRWSEYRKQQKAEG
ncbi:MAG: hypothetical protein IT163_02740 [Bryobacterales bacterium]|nr:hypothetical protein [Bryobacterales bacterium]